MNHRLIAVAVIASFVAACSSDSAMEPIVTSVAGTWTLTEVNGKALPYVYGASDPRLELIAKQYVISPAGTFTTSYTLRGTDLDGTVTTSTISDAGTSTLESNTVTFVYRSDGSVVTAHVTPTRMTIYGAVTQLFTRQ